MKKIAVILLCIGVGIGSLTGCGTTNNKAADSGSAVEEVKYCDDDFVKDFGKGLEKRWKLTDADENKDGYDDIELNSDQWKKMMLTYINAELDTIEKYTNEKFENTALQENAIKYINLLKQQKESCDYITVDYDKYSEKADEIYNERSKIIKDMVENYGVTVDEKYQDTLNEFLTNSQLVEEDESLKEAVGLMLGKIEITTTDDGTGYYTCEGYVENTTGYDFDNISIKFNLYDDEGVLVDNQPCYLENFTNGTKARLEFYTDQDFSTFETSAEWWDN